MEIGCNATEQAIMDVLRTIRGSGIPDHILVTPITAKLLAPKIFERLLSGGFLMPDFDCAKERDGAVDIIEKALLRDREHGLPVAASDASLAEIAGKIFSDLDAWGNLSPPQ